MVTGLASGWSLASHSNSVFPGGACIVQPRWMLVRGILGSGWTHSVSFRHFGTLPVGGGLLVPYSLSGSPVIKQLMQMVAMVPGQGGQFQSVCFPLHSYHNAINKSGLLLYLVWKWKSTSQNVNIMLFFHSHTYSIRNIY